MDTTWKFKNIDALADHLEQRGASYRENAARFPEKSLRRAEFRGRATESESIAYLLRHLELDNTST